MSKGDEGACGTEGADLAWHLHFCLGLAAAEIKHFFD